MTDPLAPIDGYLDAVARAATRAEGIGPFTLFVREGPGSPFYARPKPGESRFTVADVETVLARQRELGVPRTFEWLMERAPGLGDALRAAGLQIRIHPLMVLGATELAGLDPPAGTTIVTATAEDDLASMMAVAELGFGSPGTAIGAHGPEALAGAAAAIDPTRVEIHRRRIRGGQTVTVTAWQDGRPVATGSHQPVGGVTEIVGVATLPALRRRGLGAAVASALAADAFARAAPTVFLSADDDTVARVYARVGFRQIGHAGAAEPA